MPYDPIKVGTVPNDRTGDPNRAAWIKANTMLQELFGAVALQATAAALTTESNARTSGDADLAAQLAAKADNSVVNQKAGLIQVPRIDDAVGLTSDQRILLADNTGLMVSIPFVLFQPDETPLPSLFELPPLPGDFRIHTVHLLMNKAGGSSITASLLSDENELIAKADHVETTAQGAGGAKLSTYSTVLYRARNYRLEVTALDSIAEGYEPHLGLVFWLRGSWSRSMFSSGGGEEGGESVSNLGAYGQAELDFGSALYLTEKVFTVVDTRVNPQSNVNGNLAYAATANHTLDEISMEDFTFSFAPGDGQFTVLAKSLHGSVHGKFALNYHLN